MDFTVKRDRLNYFEKATIEIDNFEDLTALVMALDHHIKYMEKNLFNVSDDKDIQDLYNRTLKIRNNLDLNKDY